MKIVIDIDEREYEIAIKRKNMFPWDLTRFEKIITNGTLLEQEHCEDAISRHAAIEEIRNLKISIAGKDIFPNEAKETIIKTLDELPSVQPMQRAGHWIMTNDYITTAYGSLDYVRCSCCREDSLEEGDYCPNCGAKMAVPQESEEK